MVLNKFKRKEECMATGNSGIQVVPQSFGHGPEWGPGQGSLEPTAEEKRRLEIISLKFALQNLLDKSFNLIIGNLSTSTFLESFTDGVIEASSPQTINELKIAIDLQKIAFELLQKRNYSEAYLMAADQAEVRIREMLDPGCLMTYRQLFAIRFYLGEVQELRQTALTRGSMTFLNHGDYFAEIINSLPEFVRRQYLSRFGELLDDQVISGKEARGQAETESQKIARLIDEGVKAITDAAKRYFPSGDQLHFNVQLSVICQQQNGNLVVIKDQLTDSNFENLKNEATVKSFVENLIRTHETTFLGTKAVVFSVEIADLISPVI